MSSESKCAEKNEISKPAKILYIINSFQGYHYKGGGAQTQLGLILKSMTDNLPDKFSKTVLVTKAPDVGNRSVTYPDKTTTIIGSSTTYELVHNFLLAASSHHILHFATSFFSNPYKLLGATNIFHNKPSVMLLSSNDEIEKLKKPKTSLIIRAIKNISVFVSQSEELTDQALSVGIPRSKIRLVNNVVD